MREATQKEIEQLGAWFKGYGLAKWLSDETGIYPVESFEIRGGFDSDDEGGDNFHANYVRVNDTLFEVGEEPDEYPSPEYSEWMAMYDKMRDMFSVGSGGYYDSGPSEEWMILKLCEGEVKWDKNNPPVKLMVAE